MTTIEQAYAIREAMDVAGATLTDEKALECVRLYRPWEVGRVLSVGEFLTYGANSVGDPQLYKVVIEHTAQADWTPDTSPSLFTPIGLDDEGYPIWSQPTGSHDAYNTGDIVNYNGTLYKSLIDGNTYSPDDFVTRLKAIEDPAGYDLVVLFGGVNDYLAGIEFENTFVPKVNEFFAYLVAKFTNARICVLTPLRTAYYYAKNAAGFDLHAYSDYIKEAARTYCLPVLNLTDESGFCPHVKEFCDQWTLQPAGYDSHDGVHPTEEYERLFLAPMIKQFLNRFI